MQFKTFQDIPLSFYYTSSWVNVRTHLALMYTVQVMLCTFIGSTKVKWIWNSTRCTYNLLWKFKTASQLYPD